MHQKAVANEAAVHEDVDRVAIRLLDLWARKEAAEAEEASGRLIRLAAKLGDGVRRRDVGRREEELSFVESNFNQIVERLAAEDLIDAFLQGGDGRYVKQFGGPAQQLKRFIGMRKAVVGDEGRDMRQFGLLCAQEFATGRHIIKEVADGDGGATSLPRLFTAQHFAARDFDARAGGFFGGSRFEQEARDGGNRWKGFAAKAKGGDGEEIFDVAQFAGGMAFEGKQRVVTHHTAAIVNDADQTAPAGFDFDEEICGAGVERIFE